MSPNDRIDSIMRELTLDEKLSLLTGADFWHTRGIPRLGLQPFRMTDGPHGVTVSRDVTGPATCFPTGVGLGAAWNTDLLREIGAALGREARARKSQVLLGPAVDIHRSPLNGRNYESYSEDPFLAGSLAAAYIDGAASEGIGCAIKHYTCNNQQTRQHETDVRVDERTLREIYLPAFRMAVDAGVLAVMNAYNSVNGFHCSENEVLLSHILKDELGFKGFIVSDWRSVHSTRALEAGLDLEMPGPGKHLTAENLRAMLERGETTEERIDESIERLVGAVLRIDAERVSGGTERTGELDTPRHRELARRAACESITLLKNEPVPPFARGAGRGVGDLSGLAGRGIEGSPDKSYNRKSEQVSAHAPAPVLPLDIETLSSIAVIGPNAAEARLGGGGSSSVTPFYSVSPIEGIRAKCADRVDVRFAEGCSLSGNLPLLDSHCLVPAAPAVRAARDAQGAPHKDDQVHGLIGYYYPNRRFSGDPVLVRTDGQIDFSWGWAAPGEGLPKDEFSVRWEGDFVPPESGDYTIGVSAEEGGFRLYIDGNLKVDEWMVADEESFENLYTAKSGETTFECKHGESRSIRLEYTKTGNRAGIRLEWARPGQTDPITDAVGIAGGSDAVLVFAGISNKFEGGNNDRIDMLLPGEQVRLIREIAAANDRTIVVLINGSPVETASWIGDVSGVIEAWYPGQEGGNAIADILFGDANPSGKLPTTLPVRIEDTPSYGNFPGTDGEVNYEEGIFVGYRHYDTHGIEPAFPFGFGLSYTTFSYSNPVVEIAGAEPAKGERIDNVEVGPQKERPVISVSVDVANTGERKGKEIVQLYISDAESSVPRPYKELQAFEKVELEVGEKRTVRFDLPLSAFAFYTRNGNAGNGALSREIDPGRRVEPGIFTIRVGGDPNNLLSTDCEYRENMFFPYR